MRAAYHAALAEVIAPLHDLLLARRVDLRQNKRRGPADRGVPRRIAAVLAQRRLIGRSGRLLVKHHEWPRTHVVVLGRARGQVAGVLSHRVDELVDLRGILRGQDRPESLAEVAVEPAVTQIGVSHGTRAALCAPHRLAPLILLAVVGIMGRKRVGRGRQELLAVDDIGEHQIIPARVGGMVLRDCRKEKRHGQGHAK